MKVALFGYGHLGRFHFNCLKQTEFELIGICDPKLEEGSEIEGVAINNNVDQLISQVEACVLASDTSSHYLLASKVLHAGKHLFVEKPMTSTREQAEKLVKLAEENPQLITQVGFVERYNPAFRFLGPHITIPKFIEVHRLSTFNSRGNDVSVVSDLMIHDLDLILAIKQSKIKDIKAHGVKLLSDTLDICNARIEFEDKSIANLTASRMSLKTMRKFRIFQDDGYLSMDLDKKESQIVQLSDENFEGTFPIQAKGKTKFLSVKSSGILEGNAILTELKEFYNSIKTSSQSSINFKNALKTSRLADQIERIALESTGL